MKDSRNPEYPTKNVILLVVIGIRGEGRSKFYDVLCKDHPRNNLNSTLRCQFHHQAHANSSGRMEKQHVTPKIDYIITIFAHKKTK